MWATPKCCSSSTTKEREVLEFDVLAQQRVGTDHDINAAVREPFSDLAQLGCGHKARGLRHVDGKSSEALGKRLEVLARKQRGRHHDGDLFPANGCNKCSAQRNFGLSEPDVAADKPIHRTSRAQVLDGRIDGSELIVGFFVREPRTKFVIGARADGQSCCLM